jgi:hypothetical protein
MSLSRSTTLFSQIMLLEWECDTHELGTKIAQKTASEQIKNKRKNIFWAHLGWSFWAPVLTSLPPCPVHAIVLPDRAKFPRRVHRNLCITSADVAFVPGVSQAVYLAFLSGTRSLLTRTNKQSWSIQHRTGAGSKYGVPRYSPFGYRLQLSILICTALGSASPPCTVHPRTRHPH